VSGQLHASGERALDTHWTSEPVWAIWRTENSWPYRDSNSDPSVVQPVASRYTDYAIPAPYATYIRIYIYIYIFSPRRLPPYRGEEFCEPQWPWKLCWRERKLPVEPFMSDRSEGRGQMKCSPCSSRSAFGRSANNLTSEKFFVMKPWRRPRAARSYSASIGGGECKIIR
jgi:hypothetical protein